MYVCMEPCLKEKTWQLRRRSFETVINSASWSPFNSDIRFSPHILAFGQSYRRWISIYCRSQWNRVDFKIFQLTRKSPSLTFTFDEWCGGALSPVSGPLLWRYTLRGWLWTFHGGQPGDLDTRHGGLLVVYGGFLVVSYLFEHLQRSLASQTLSCEIVYSRITSGFVFSVSILHLIC